MWPLRARQQQVWRRHLVLAAAASGGDRQQPQQPPPPPPSSSSDGSDTEEDRGRPGLFANILKPLRDFGIGRTSMVQGGVGLFVFSGIGGCWPAGREAATSSLAGRPVSHSCSA